MTSCQWVATQMKYARLTWQEVCTDHAGSRASFAFGFTFIHTCALLCCRQAYRTLRQLLGYDPTRSLPGQPGYGAGSGAPDIMFGFLKHLWATRQPAGCPGQVPALQWLA